MEKERERVIPGLRKADSCCMGYATDAGIRENAASGGLVTALLCSMLENHEIDGAWVTKSCFTAEGELAYHTRIATTPEEIRDCSSSVYMFLPLLRHVELVRQFQGRVAVVLTPCTMRALDRLMECDEVLRQKIVLKLGLFCSGGFGPQVTEYALDKCFIPTRDAVRLYYRRGHWRGKSSVVYADGAVREFSYTRAVGAYKNAYFFMNEGCFSCKDQFNEMADISFGDVWLPGMKHKKIKYTGCIVRSQKAKELLQQAKDRQRIQLEPMTQEMMLRSQRRALNFKFRSHKWNRRLAGWLAKKNQRFSYRHPKILKAVPLWAIDLYMCVIRVLLSW